MTDFDPFTSNEEKRETDVVADFLNREEKQLAELNDIDDLPSNSVTVVAEESGLDLGNNDSDIFGQSASETIRAYDSLDITKDSRGMDEETSRFDRYDALKEEGPSRIETEKIRKWQEEQKERLIIKDAESEKKQKEWLQIALLELDEHQKHREEQLHKTKKSNRQAEEAFIRERDVKKPGGEWERVCRVCDFNPKTSTRPTKDISRLRSLLLQLKQAPNVSFAAA